MKLSENQFKFAHDVSLLIDFIFKHNYSCTFGEAFRTQEQAEIYARKDIGIKDSLHCKRLAVDLNVFNSRGEYLADTNEYAQFGLYWENLDKSNRWGGRFKDGNHFERQEK